MRVAMVAEFGTGLEPAAQQVDPRRRDGAVGGVELVLVDEPDHRYAMRGDGGEQLARQLTARLEVARQHPGNRQVVEGDRDLARRRLRANRADGDRENTEPETSEHSGCAPRGCARTRASR